MASDASREQAGAEARDTQEKQETQEICENRETNDTTTGVNSHGDDAQDPCSSDRPEQQREPATAAAPAVKEPKEPKEEENQSVTVYARSESSPRSGLIEVDTSKVHVDASGLEASRNRGDLETVPQPPAGLEHVSNLEILNAAQQPPAWLMRRRWWILGCGIVLVLLAAILVIGLVAGLVLTRRPDDGGGADAPTTANGTGDDNSTSANSSCGSIRHPVRRQVLAAAAAESTLFLFARGTDDDVWYRSLGGGGGGGNESWLHPWLPLVPGGTALAGPPTAIAWAPWGHARVSVFAAAADARHSVLTTTYGNGSWRANWENLGESAASPVALCRLPAGFESSAAGTPERIDQWVVNRASRGIFHDFWQYVVDGFQEPATYTEWEGSMANQASASMPGVVCRGLDPIHSLLMYANGTDSVRFRHYTGASRVWNPWVDLGGTFKGDPVLLPTGDMTFSFFGIDYAGAIWTFNWTNVTGVGYRPAMTSLGGNFSSMPSAVLTTTSNFPISGNAPPRIDVVALGQDGRLKHQASVDGAWQADWEDLGVAGASAPHVFQYEVASDSGAKKNKTMVAAIGDDNQLYFATWDVSDSLTWRGFMREWASVGGNLTTKSMCD